MSTEANKNQQLRSAQPTLSDRERYFQGPGLDVGED